MRNDLIAASLNAETVDIISAQHRGKIRSGLAQIHSLGTKLVAIKNNLGLRLVKLHVGISEDEQAAGHGFLNELLRKLTDLLWFGRRHNRKVDGKLPPPGSGGGVRGITRTPAIFESGPDDSISNSCVVFLRWLQGFVTMPPKPPEGFVI